MILYIRNRTDATKGGTITNRATRYLLLSVIITSILKYCPKVTYLIILSYHNPYLTFLLSLLLTFLKIPLRSIGLIALTQLCSSPMSLVLSCLLVLCVKVNSATPLFEYDYRDSVNFYDMYVLIFYLICVFFVFASTLGVKVVSISVNDRSVAAYNFSFPLLHPNSQVRIALALSKVIIALALSKPSSINSMGAVNSMVFVPFRIAIGVDLIPLLALGFLFMSLILTILIYMDLCLRRLLVYPCLGVPPCPTHYVFHLEYEPAPL